ncbi:MAG: hypothetical protein KAH56_06500, partial [Candidatus Krumholzibacteria bacterium]|nr:hypothetical protein [Candidatus Krumholzibacteria bacterium]
LVNDHPFFPDKFTTVGAAMEIPYSAAVVIPFRAEVVARARITIEDIEGSVIRVVLDMDILPGSHSWIWDGRNDAGDLQPSGRYTAHLVTTKLDTGELMFEDRTDMLLSMLDPSRVPVGFTGRDGKLVLRDMKLFPHLYDRPDMTATNENAEPIGEFSPSSMMRISLADTGGGGHMNFMMEVPGATTLDLVWDPRMAVSANGPDYGERETPSVPRVNKIEPDEPPFELRLVYPNPFN